MTGFGAASTSFLGWTMKVEVRSVNHRGLDVRVWCPRDWTWIEPFVHNGIREYVHRGRVEIRVDAERDLTSAGATFIDLSRFVRAADELRDAARAAKLEGEPTIRDVLEIGEVHAKQDGASVPDDHSGFEAVIREALGDLVKSRVEEGEKLRETMQGHLDEVSRALAAIRTLMPLVASEYQSRLEVRLREALEKYEVHQIDEKSLLHEVAIYADRSDISEESQRAESHIAKLAEIFADHEDGAPLGKQIDFYLQELMREANTTGAKSGSIEITNHVIAMKSAVEQMREQAANIE